MRAAYRVDYIESESGWGQRLDCQTDFETLEEANKAVQDFNTGNNEATTPGWYMYACAPRLIDLDVERPPKK